MRSLLAKLGLTVATVLVLLGTLELAFRWVGVDRHALSAEAIWEAQNLSGAGRARVLAGGYEFWEDPIAEEAFSPNSLRLLFLGDSFTAGYGVADVDRFSDRLESRLRLDAESGGAGRDVHVFNAGMVLDEKRS